MKQQGRHSPHQLAPVQLPEVRVQPPEGMPPGQAALWRQVVATKPASWFSADSLPLLTQYVRHVETAGILEQRLLATTDPDDIDHLLHVRLQETKAIIALATAMRLAQNSRMQRDVAATQHNNQGGETKPWDTPAV